MKTPIDLFKAGKSKELSKFYSDNKEKTTLELKDVVPAAFKTIDDYKKFMHDFCIQNSIDSIKVSLSNNDLISVYVNYLDILDELINSWFERVFEHLTIYYPEASIKAQDLANFQKIKELSRESLAKVFGVEKESMGLDLSKQDLDMLHDSITMLNSLTNQKAEFEKRTEALTEELAPNTSKVAGTLVAARLISAAGSLKRLMMMPSSTIQVLGAEKALFRHLRSRNKSRPPKHGIIFHSIFISSAALKHRGKMARALASKISISTKVDYYKGQPIWQRLVASLEAKMKGLK